MVNDYQYRIAFFRYPRLFSREGLEPESLACVLVLFFLLTKMMMARWWRFFFSSYSSFLWYTFGAYTRRESGESTKGKEIRYCGIKLENLKI